MKRSVLLIVAVLFFMAEETFAGSVITQRVMNACGFVKGSTTLSLSGQLNDAAMQSIASGNAMAIYNSLDSYLAFPTLFPRTKTGFGAKTATQNVSVNTKNGKFKWMEKDVTPYFAFATGREKIKPSKAVFKSRGTLQTYELSELGSKKLTVLDKLCANQNGVYLASLALFPENKGKNYKFSYNENGIQTKGSINSKGKITAQFLLTFEDAFPAFIEDGNIYTNKYDYSLVIVGEGDVRSGFYGPDQVEFRVVENKDKFRYFSYNGTIVTNDFMTLELEDDTEVQAVFGTYDLSVNVVGNGDVNTEFIGPDEVEIKVTENIDKFRYFTVNGDKFTGSKKTLTLRKNTIVKAVFGNYDLNITISGKGSVSHEFVGPDEVIVTATSPDGSFNRFKWDENISRDNPLKFTMTKNTKLFAIFIVEYMVIDLSGGPNAEYYPVDYLDGIPDGGWTDEHKTTKLVLRKIEPGTFTMGSPDKELGRSGDETQHQVTLTKSYYIGVFETTQKQYELIMGRNSSYYEGDVRPVEYVSYNTLRGTDKGAAWPTSYDVDDDSFFGILRAKTQMTFDLPTEAQWEFACRAGTTTALNSGKNLSDRFECYEMAEVGRYIHNGGQYIAHAKVGSYLPNAWGLYDMHGNVREWCLDWYASYDGDATDPKGASSGSYRVLRGGSCGDYAFNCRSAYRINSNPVYGNSSLGFRVVLVQNVFSGPDNQIQKDFEFEIESGTENTLPIFQTKFYGKLKNGTEKPLEEMGKLEYDGASGIVAGIGKHHLTWIPDNAYTNIMDEVELRVEHEDVTEQANYLVLDTLSNKMRVSPEGPDTSDDKCRTDELWLRRIEPGMFVMGSPKKELGRRDNEISHYVLCTEAYYIGVFEVTQKQYQNVMSKNQNIRGKNPSYYKGDARPVESVSYGMLRGFVIGHAWPKNRIVDDGSFMGQLRKKAGNIFDLPTEAQWEYACRAGTTTALNSGKNLSGTGSCTNLAEVGRYIYNQNDGKGGYSQHTIVGSYLPNAWGLYDMHGNVSELCLDWYQEDLGIYLATDPEGADSGTQRVYRGGNWNIGARACRSADRRGSDPKKSDFYTGFRVVLVQ